MLTGLTSNPFTLMFMVQDSVAMHVDSIIVHPMFTMDTEIY